MLNDIASEMRLASVIYGWRYELKPRPGCEVMCDAWGEMGDEREVRRSGPRSRITWADDESALSSDNNCVCVCVCVCAKVKVRAGILLLQQCTHYSQTSHNSQYN